MGMRAASAAGQIQSVAPLVSHAACADAILIRMPSTPGCCFQVGKRRAVVVLERAEDADGSWHVERRDPFADYRRVFNRAAKMIVAVGVATDTDQVGGRAVAEVGDLEWQPGASP